MAINWLAAHAEMEVRQNIHSIERDEDFVLLHRRLYFESLGRMAQEQEEFGKKLAKKLLASINGT